MNADWDRVGADLDAHGCAHLPSVLGPDDCALLAAAYDDQDRFRSRVVMERHGFGRGEYQYFGYPLPDMVAALRAGLYGPLAAIANRWQAALGLEERFPAAHEAY